MKLDFYKLVGTGNDFIFIKHSKNLEKIKGSQLAKQLCDRKQGIGADGLAIFKANKENRHHFSWNFYNSDGSCAEMCGNAARCAALYFREIYRLDFFQLETSMGIVKGKYRSENCEVQWKLKNETPLEKTIRLESGQDIQGEFIDTGVPHFVVLNNEYPLNKFQCFFIHKSSAFAPKKTNVTLLTRDDKRGHQTKSFERGVEDFTMACGTGVVASALVLKKLSGKKEYVLQTPGGSLKVKLKEKYATLIGPVQISFSGTLNL